MVCFCGHSRELESITGMILSCSCITGRVRIVGLCKTNVLPGEWLELVASYLVAAMFAELRDRSKDFQHSCHSFPALHGMAEFAALPSNQNSVECLPQVAKRMMRTQIQWWSVLIRSCTRHRVLLFQISFNIFFLRDTGVKISYSNLMTRFLCCQILVNEPVLEICLKLCNKIWYHCV